jgi:hypothetical protein
LQQLEEKMRVKNTDSKEHAEDGTVPVPLPEWDKERERESRDKDRSRTSSEGRDEKTVRDTRDTAASDFRQLTQVLYCIVHLVHQYVLCILGAGQG